MSDPDQIFSEFLDTLDDVPDNRSMEEVKSELREGGIDPDTAIARLKNKIKEHLREDRLAWRKDVAAKKAIMSWDTSFWHPNARQFDAVDAKQSSDWSENQATEEYEANLFAAELLIMPTQMFAPKTNGVTPSFDLIEQLSTEFQTTLTATAVQFVLNCRGRGFGEFWG
jgi:hypothetical protein